MTRTKSDGCLTSREICLEANDEVAYPFAWIHEPVAGWLAGADAKTKN